MRTTLIVGLLLCSSITSAADTLPDRYTDKIEGMPDFCQGDERFGAMPQHGAELCGPTAASNTIVWLSQNGFAKLAPRHRGLPADQSDLIRKLCSADFFATDMKTGTPPKQIVNGIEKFVQACGYDCQIEQMGWRSSLHRRGLIPDEHWMLQSCMGSSNLLINVGWYKNHDSKYVRDEGHWLTLVGFARRDTHRILYVHDPAIGSGIEKKTEECHLVPLPRNHTLGLRKGEPTNADGYFELKGIRLKKGADLAIIDGAIAFQPLQKDP